MNRRVLVNIVVFTVLSFIMIGWTVQNVVSIEALERPYDLSGDFAAGSGLTKEAQVTYLGVPIGSVSSLAAIPIEEIPRIGRGGVRVKMKIERGKKIPVGSTANIQRKTAIGEPIIDFRPPPGSDGAGPSIPPGTRIPISETTVPLEFGDLLRSASLLIGSISPEALKTVIHEASVGLEGTSESFRVLTDASDRLGATLLAKDAAIRRLATNNTALTKVLADHAPDLQRSIADLNLVAQALRAAKEDTNRLLDVTPALMSELSGLIEGSRTDIDCSLRVLGQVIDLSTTDKHLRELRALLDIGPTAFAGLWDAVDYEPDGPWIRVNLIQNGDNPPVQYMPRKELEAPRAPAACPGVAAAASGRDYSPASQEGLPLPATGRDGSLVFVGILLAAALVLRLVSRQEG